MKHSPITRALIKARKAFNKAAEALPEYETLQKARAAHEQRQTSVDRAQRLLRFILKWEPSTTAQDLALFRQAATIHGYEELGHDKVQKLIAAMNAIENRHLAAEREAEATKRAENAAWRGMAAGGGQALTNEERRLILSTLHPDANPSPERREAAFKAFNAKR